MGDCDTFAANLGKATPLWWSYRVLLVVISACGVWLRVGWVSSERHVMLKCSSRAVQVWERWASLRGMGERRRFCKESFLSFETMETIDDLRRELYSVSGTDRKW